MVGAVTGTIVLVGILRTRSRTSSILSTSSSGLTPEAGLFLTERSTSIFILRFRLSVLITQLNIRHGSARFEMFLPARFLYTPANANLNE